MGSKTEVSAPPSRTQRGDLSLQDPETLALLRQLLTDAKFNEAEIRRTCQAESVESIPISDIQLLDRILPRTGLLPSLIRFFLCSLPADPAALASVLKPLSLERLQGVGVLRLGPASAEPLVRLLPVDGMAVAAELHPDDSTDVPADFVIGVNPTSVALATVTSRRHVKAALDIGTGCGIQSLLASRHCDRVVATDLNARAINFTAFNCMLNGITNVECRQGSLFEPVAGEKFDLVVSNPPYVISPDSNFQYRDSGQPLDTFCRTLVKALPAHLNEGGYAAVLSNWALRGDEHWSAPVREWVGGSGCDALIFHTYTESPLGYAGTWNRFLAKSRPAAFGAAIDRWTDHFRRSGIAAIASGGVILRKHSGRPNWIDTTDVPTKRDPHCGEHILRMIAARDWLAGPVTDDDMLKSIFHPAPEFKLEQALGVQDGRLAPSNIWASLSMGFRFRGEIDAPTAQLLMLSDGRRRLGEIVDRLAADMKAPIDEFRRKSIGMVRELYASGLLLRA